MGKKRYDARSCDLLSVLSYLALESSYSLRESNYTRWERFPNSRFSYRMNFAMIMLRFNYRWTSLRIFSRIARVKRSSLLENWESDCHSYCENRDKILYLLRSVTLSPIEQNWARWWGLLFWFIFQFSPRFVHFFSESFWGFDGILPDLKIIAKNHCWTFFAATLTKTILDNDVIAIAIKSFVCLQSFRYIVWIAFRTGASFTDLYSEERHG